MQSYAALSKVWEIYESKSEKLYLLKSNSFQIQVLMISKRILEEQGMEIITCYEVISFISRFWDHVIISSLKNGISLIYLKKMKLKNVVLMKKMVYVINLQNI